MAGTNGAGVWGYFAIISLLLTIIAPLVYGWYSRDGTGAILIGAIPILLITGVFRVITGNVPAESGYLIYSIVYIALLCMVGGLGGILPQRKLQDRY